VDNLYGEKNEIWGKIRNSLQGTLPVHAFDAWFEPIKAIALNGNELVLEVPNQFFYEWIESHYKAKLASVLNNEGLKEILIKYTVSAEQELIPSVIQEEKTITRASPRKAHSNLNKNYTFATCIEGPHNQFAKAAAQTVAEEPGKVSFNPLVIYGGVGLGKTHLINAIGNEIINLRPEKRVVSASSEKFTQDFITSIQKHKTIEFSKTYRNADVLLIDDIQFFQGKESTQEQFFHTFNDLYQSGKQIVLTADKYPGEMKGLQDRLLSRFQSGLAVDIQPPDFETRVAIIMDKSEQNGLELPYEIAEFIASHIKKSVRDMESTIIRLLAYSSLANHEIDMGLAKKVVKERLGSRALADTTIEDIVKRVSEITHVNEREIIGKSRKKHIAEARQVAIYLTRDILGSSLINIGTHFGGKDHTTILHACRTIDSKMQKDDRIKNIIDTVKKEISMTFA